ncbi:MAG: hypothetical protein IT342_06155, partial [Candidatus Melainabacteria bacterium]|nr:hypothetical protein [Candidatus Melainabacteria bacterium]
MKLLVSTPHWIFLVDSVSHQVEVLESARREYYGISWTPNSQLVLTHSGLENVQISSFLDYIDSEKGGLSLGSDSTTDVLSCPHQILCVDDRIAVTNTGRNCLTVFRTDDFYYRHFWFDKQRWDKAHNDQKGSHFNSVFLKDLSLYLLAHNRDLPSYILKLSWPQLEILERIETTAMWAHNIWMTDSSQLIICNTANGSVDDVNSGAVLWKSDDSDVLTRGLACADNLIFVGCSSRGAKGDRTESDGGIWVLERSTWALIDFISLPFAGNVHEIRILDARDECHHRIPFSGKLQRDPLAAEQFRDCARILQVAKPPDGWKMQAGKCDWTNDQEFTLNAPFAIATLIDKPMKNVRMNACMSLEQSGPGAHIALVGRYLGPMDDNMYAGMLYKDEHSYSAQIWKNIAGTWSLKIVEQLHACPERLTFEAVENHLTLSVDNRVVL